MEGSTGTAERASISVAQFVSADWQNTSSAQADENEKSKNNREHGDEDQLVAAAKSGCRNAFDLLFARHMKRVLSMALRITKNQEDAEDAVQESFLSAYMHLKTFDERSQFSTWLTRIAINASLMRLRKNGRLREMPLAGEREEESRVPELADLAPNPEELYAGKQQERILRKAIRGLRPTLRRTIRLHHSNHGSLRETSRALGISLTATKARLFRARAALRDSPEMRAIGAPL